MRRVERDSVFKKPKLGRPPKKKVDLAKMLDDEPKAVVVEAKADPKFILKSKDKDLGWETKAEPAKPAVKPEIDGDDGTVIVGLKMPHGLHLSTFMMRVVQEAQPNGFRDVSRAFPSGLPQVKLNGYVSPTGISPLCEVVAGFAITKGVPAKVWNLWFEQNKQDSDLISRGLVFASREYDKVTSYAKEHSKLLNGLEPINPEGDSKMPGLVSPNISKLKKFDKNDFAMV